MDATTNDIKLESWPDHSGPDCDPLAIAPSAIQEVDIKKETGCMLTASNHVHGRLKTEDCDFSVREFHTKSEFESRVIKTEDPLAIHNLRQNDAVEGAPQLAMRLHCTFCSDEFMDHVSLMTHLQSGCNKDLEAASIQTDDPLSTHNLPPASLEEDAALLAKIFHCAACSAEFPDRKSLRKHLTSRCSGGIIGPHEAVQQLDRILRKANKVMQVPKKIGRPMNKVEQSADKVTQKTKNIGKKVAQESKNVGRPEKKLTHSLSKVYPSSTTVTRSSTRNIALESMKVARPVNKDTKDGKKVGRSPSKVTKPANKVTARPKKVGGPAKKVGQAESDTDWSEKTDLSDRDTDWMEEENGASNSSTDFSEKRERLKTESILPESETNQTKTKPALPKNKSVDKRHLCNICGKKFQSLLNFRIHLSRHMGETNFECAKCKMKFTRHRHLRKHVSLEHGKKYECDSCDKKFSYKSSLRAHMLTHPERKQYRCDECDKTFSSDEGKSAHMLSHGKENKSMCEVCGKRFLGEASLQKHLRVHTGPKNHRCPLCDPSWSSLGLKLQHKILSTNRSGCPYVNSDNLKNKPEIAVDRKHKCETCGEAFRLMIELRRHNKAVHRPVEPRPFECALCGKTYPKQCRLRQHMLFHTSGKNYKCHHCPLVFTGRRMLFAHLDMLLGKFPYMCRLCPALFAQESSLKEHVLSHSETSERQRRHVKFLELGHRKKNLATQCPKKFQCTLCKKSYKHQSTLDRHVKNQHGERIHTCEDCGKGFGTAYYARVHFRAAHALASGKATGNVYYECDFCNKRYGGGPALLRHVEGKHSPEAEAKLIHRCEHCDFRCSKASTLKTHWSAVHKKKRDANRKGKHKCDVCGKGFCSAYYLRHHVKTRHGPDGGRDEFVCDVCDKRYRYLARLRRHIENVHLAEVYYLPEVKYVPELDCRPEVNQEPEMMCEDVVENKVTVGKHLV